MASHFRTGGEGANGNAIAIALADVLQRMVEDAARLQVQEVLRLQEQEAERRIQETLRLLEQESERRAQETSRLQEQLQERDEAIRALLDERVQRVTAREERVGSSSVREGSEEAGRQRTLEQLEARIAVLEERMGSFSAREGSEEAGGQRALEDRMGNLEKAVQRALTTVFPKVDALVALLEEPSSPSSSCVAASASSAGTRGAEAATDEGRELLRVKRLCQKAKARYRRARDAPSSLGEDLCKAAFEGSVGLVRRLLGLGADVNYASCTGYTPLIAAFYFDAWGRSNPRVVSLLLARGANVNAVSGCSGASALHFAACCDNGEQCLEILLRAGASVNAREEFGGTPLHGAATRGNENCVRALLAAGARKDLRCWSGEWENKTPFDVAESRAIRDLLRP